jgi:hypothetical protein
VQDPAATEEHESECDDRAEAGRCGVDRESAGAGQGIEG